MAKFSRSSREKMKQLHIGLQAVLWKAIQVTDFTVIWGYRGEEEQNEAFAKGNSKLKFPESKHNRSPSHAVDLAPYPKLYDAPIHEFCYLAGVVMACAYELGAKVRWGGDWNMNDDTEDQPFKDWGHFEIMEV